MIRATVYMWQSLSFPLWHPDAPPEDRLVMVSDIVRRHASTGVDCAKVGSHLEWGFGVSLDETQRRRVQSDLVESFSRDVARHFRWSGALAHTEIDDVIALGEHVQDYKKRSE